MLANIIGYVLSFESAYVHFL